MVVVRIPRLLRSSFGRALDSSPDTSDRKIDEGLVESDVLGVLILLEGPLDILREVRVSGLPARAGSVPSPGYPETVMVGVGLADVGRLDLGDLESPEPDESAKLEHHVVPI